MSFSVAPPPRVRPGTVVAGAVALFVAAAALAGVAVAQFAIIPVTGRAVEAVATGPDEAGFGSAFSGVLYGGGGAMNLLFSVLLAALAGFDLAGKQPARVMSWIFGPLALLCCGCGSVAYSDALLGFAADSPNAGANDEMMTALAEAIPSWFTPVVLILLVVAAMSVLLATILLALPASNQYFRPPSLLPPGWLPQWPGGYPGPYPVPGQPMPGQDDPNPWSR